MRVESHTTTRIIASFSELNDEQREQALALYAHSFYENDELSEQMNYIQDAGMWSDFEEIHNVTVRAQEGIYWDADSRNVSICMEIEDHDMLRILENNADRFFVYELRLIRYLINSTYTFHAATKHSLRNLFTVKDIAIDYSEIPSVREETRNIHDDINVADRFISILESVIDAAVNDAENTVLSEIDYYTSEEFFTDQIELNEMEFVLDNCNNVIAFA